MSAGDALPRLNACAYLATIQHFQVLHVAVHGTPMSFFGRKLLFSSTYTLLLLRFPFQNKIARAIKLA